MSPPVAKKPVLVLMWDPHRPGHLARPSKEAVEKAVFGSDSASLASYLENQTNGAVQIEKAGVLDWFDADKPADHYWNHPADAHDGFTSGHVEKWAEVLKKADARFDFARYDKNHDHKLSAGELSVLIMIPQAGSFGTNRFAEDVNGKALKLDGVEIGMIAEVYTPKDINHGVIRHELSHRLMELPDLYTYEPHNGAGAYSLMDVTYTDAQIDAVLKLQKGWVSAKKVTGPGAYELRSVERSREVIKIEKPGSSPKEYLVIEKRERGTYDKDLKDVGYVVWRMVEGADARAVYRFEFDGKGALDPANGFKMELLKWRDGTGAALVAVDSSMPDRIMITPVPRPH